MGSTYNPGPGAVRFSDRNEEIAPAPQFEGEGSRGNVPPEMEQQLRNLSANMQRSGLQESRIGHYQFEPVSLPPSRVCTKLEQFTTPHSVTNRAG